MKHLFFGAILACSAVPLLAQPLGAASVSAPASAPVALAAGAASPQADAAVRELLTVMDVRAMMAASFGEIEKTLPAMMRAQVMAEIAADPGATQASRDQALARIERFLPHASEAIGRLLRDPVLIDQMVAAIGPLYARYYTVAELKQLTAFYRTPLGRKMLAVSPRLGAESMALGQAVIAPRLHALLTEVMQSAQVK